MHSDLLKLRGSKLSPVLLPLPGREKDMVPNRGGGWSFTSDQEAILKKFLLFGPGTIYPLVETLIRDYPLHVLDVCHTYSVNGNLPKEDTSLYILAKLISHPDVYVRKTAASKFNEMVRIGTHLFHFASYVDKNRGWGRLLKNTVRNWYLEKDSSKLAYDVTKYAQRDGWSHRDLLRLSKPSTQDTCKNKIFSYAVNKPIVLDNSTSLDPIRRAEEAKDCSQERLLELIAEGLPYECVPTDKRNAEVYEALLFNSAGITWVIRNLRNLETKVSLAKEHYDRIESLLLNKNTLKKGRVHPIHLLMASKAVSTEKIKQILEKAFVLSFDSVTPTGLKYLVGVDVSGSMGSQFPNSNGLASVDISACLGLLLMKTEDHVEVKGFQTSLVDLDFKKTDSFHDARSKAICRNFGSTNPGALIEYALNSNKEFDVVLIVTDNDINTGSYPSELLKKYRQKIKKNTKFIVISTYPSSYSICDPLDPYSLELIGVDPSNLAYINNFVVD